MDPEKVWKALDPSSFLESEQFADAVIVAKDGRLRAHRLMLGASCKLLRLCLLQSASDDDDAVLILPDYSVRQIRELADIVYGRNVTDFSNVRELRAEFGLDTFSEVDAYCPRAAKSAEPVDVKVECDVEEEEENLKEEYSEDDDDDFICDDDSEEDDDDDDDDDELPAVGKGKRSSSGAAKGKQQSEATMYRCEEDNCSFGAETRKKMVTHAKTHGNDPSSCNICGKVISKHLLARHVSRKHCVERASCPVCNLVLVSNYISRHIAQKHGKGDFGCLDCEKLFVTITDLEAHLQKAHKEEEMRKCVTCSKQFGCSEKVEVHESKCGQLSTMATDHNDETDLPEESTSHREIKRVVRKRKANKDIPDEEASCSKQPSRRGQKRQMVCLDCSEKFHSGPDFDNHMAVHHNGGDYSQCVHCNKICGSRKKLEEHEFLCMPLPLPARAGKYKNRRKHTAIANIDVPFLADKPNQCSYKGCSYKNSRQSRIRSHYLSKHCRQRCPYCEKILSVGHMERHVIMNHTKSYNFVCHLCSKGFFKAADLSNHIDEEHVKELKHICDLCGKGFFSQGKLYSHTYRSHLHNEWKCNPCSKVYSARKSLIKHLKAHHNGEGIADLFKDEKGNFKQVREYRHVTKSLDYAVDTVILDKSTVEAYLPAATEPDSSAPL